jgi:hypothetical protein
LYRARPEGLPSWLLGVVELSAPRREGWVVGRVVLAAAARVGDRRRRRGRRRGRRRVVWTGPVMVVMMMMMMMAVVVRNESAGGSVCKGDFVFRVGVRVLYERAFQSNPKRLLRADNSIDHQ